jgi:hypothetical protein
MGLVSTPFYAIECNGPAPTPLYRHCPTVARGDWDSDTVESNAATAGWVQQGQKWFCPLCTPADAPPKPKSRAKSDAPQVPVAEQQGSVQ